MENKKELFLMNPERMGVAIKPFARSKNLVTHYFRIPTMDEEQKKETIGYSTVKIGGKIDGNTVQERESHKEEALVKLYDLVAIAVKGYNLEGFAQEDEVDVNSLIGDKKVLDLIPAKQKVTAITGLYNFRFEPDFDDEEMVYNLTGGNTFRLKQEFGFKEDADGNLKDPDYVVKYTFKEPSEKDNSSYKRHAIADKEYFDKDNKSVSRRSVNVETFCKLFDALVTNVEGAVVDVEGTEVPVNVKEHIDLIPAYMKTDAIATLFGVLEADLGN